MIASVKPPPALKKRKLSSPQQQLRNFSQGQRGEHAAQTFLLSRGYQVLATNLGVGRGLSFNSGEVDIIAYDPETDDVVFVEVKTRSSSEFGHPSQAVSYRKHKAMMRVAQAFLRARDLENDYRFDIICVLPRQIEHFKNITW